MTTKKAKPADVPWWRWAGKAVAALVVAVVAAGGIITAALADGTVTTAEKWQIILAVLAAMGGPAAVYKVENVTGTAHVQPLAQPTTYQPTLSSSGTVEGLSPSSVRQGPPLPPASKRAGRFGDPE